MHRSHHALGSADAQAALASLAGWTPSRRGFLGGLLVASAATAAAGTAAALVVPSSAPVPSGVSPRMAHLISEFIRLNAALEAIDYSADPAAWDRAAVARGPALDDLVFEPAGTMADFAAKMTALAEIMAEQDSELFIFRVLAEDAARLAEGAR